MGDKALEEEKKKFPIWVVATILVVVGLLVAGIVCFVLIKNAEVDDLRRSRELTENIAGTKVAVEEYFSAKSETVELTDETKELFEDFENAVAKLNEYMGELGEHGAVKNGDAKSKYDEARAAYDHLREVGETEQQLMNVTNDGALSNEELDELANGKNEFLKNLANEYKEYRTKVTEYNEKYVDLKGKNKTEFDEDSAKLKQAGEDLAKKYAEIKFDDVYGMSRDDILKFYATIEELNKILAEK